MDATAHPSATPPDGTLFAPRFVAPARGLGVGADWAADQDGWLAPHPSYWVVVAAIAMAAFFHLQGMPGALAATPIWGGLAWVGAVAGHAAWRRARLRRLLPDPRVHAWPWKEADAEAMRLLREGFAGEEAPFLAQARHITVTWTGTEEGTSALTMVVKTDRHRCVYAPRDPQRLPWARQGAWWARGPNGLKHLRLLETTLDLRGQSRHQRLAWIASLSGHEDRAEAIDAAPETPPASSARSSTPPHGTHATGHPPTRLARASDGLPEDGSDHTPALVRLHHEDL